jgi:hypothetical protein
MHDFIVTIGPHTTHFSSIFHLLFDGDADMDVAPFNKRINGPKELKNIITIYQDIKSIFEDRLLENNGARYYLNDDTSPIEQINVDNKENFIKSIHMLTNYLTTLEILRKRLVNNKQQRKTAHNQNIHLLRELRKLLPPPTYSEFGGGFSLEDDPPNNHISVQILKHMDYTSKEFHHSMSRHILNDINSIITKVLPEFVFNMALSIQHNKDNCSLSNNIKNLNLL